MGNMPNIRFKHYTDDWEQRKFGDMFERRMERNGGQFDNTRWISVAKMYFQEPEKVTSNNIDTRTYVMRKGDIAFEGHPNAEFKYGRFVENDIGDGVISELFPIYKHIDEYDLNYWKYAIQLESVMQSRLVRCIEISYTSSNKLEEKSFLKESIYVPKLDEQHKIGDFFASLDNLITLHQRKCDESKELKKYMLQKMFPKNGKKQPEIRFNGFADDWEQRKLGEWCDFINGDRSSNYPSATEFVEDGIPFVGSDSLGSTLIDKTKLRFISSEKYEQMNGLKIEKNDILYTLRGAGFGKCSIADFSEGTVASSLVGIRCNESLRAKFLIQWLGSANAENEKNKAVNGSTAQNISVEDMKKYCISVPCIAEQDKISEHLYNLDNLITLHQRKCDEYKELKKYMLQNMFPQKG